MEQALLPIGSVVILKEGTKKLMIYGRRQVLAASKTEIYDYVGCLYPEGYINPDYSYVFNHQDIAAVVFTGYQDEDEKAYQEHLQEK
ncbi:MAG: DUF4176 domain-containing protein [Ectobacillus sp.]